LFTSSTHTDNAELPPSFVGTFNLDESMDILIGLFTVSWLPSLSVTPNWTIPNVLRGIVIPSAFRLLNSPLEASISSRLRGSINCRYVWTSPSYGLPPSVVKASEGNSSLATDGRSWLSPRCITVPLDELNGTGGVLSGIMMVTNVLLPLLIGIVFTVSTSCSNRLSVNVATTSFKPFLTLNLNTPSIDVYRSSWPWMIICPNCRGISEPSLRPKALPFTTVLYEHGLHAHDNTRDIL